MISCCSACPGASGRPERRDSTLHGRLPAAGRRSEDRAKPPPPPPRSRRWCTGRTWASSAGSSRRRCATGTSTTGCRPSTAQPAPTTSPPSASATPTGARPGAAWRRRDAADRIPDRGRPTLTAPHRSSPLAAAEQTGLCRRRAGPRVPPRIASWRGCRILPVGCRLPRRPWREARVAADSACSWAGSGRGTPSATRTSGGSGWSSRRAAAGCRRGCRGTASAGAMARLALAKRRSDQQLGVNLFRLTPVRVLGRATGTAHKF